MQVDALLNEILEVPVDHHVKHQSFVTFYETLSIAEPKEKSRHPQSHMGLEIGGVHTPTTQINI